MSSIRFGDPWAPQTKASLTRFNFRAMQRNSRHAVARRNGVISGVPRRVMAGDPSWLSQFIKHNSKIIGGVVGAVGTAVGLPEVGIPLGAMIAGSGGSTKLATLPSQNPIPMMQYRPTSTAGMGKAAGMTAGLAPQPPGWGQVITDVLGGNFGQAIQEGVGMFADPNADPTGGGSPPVVAIPSSGGGSMLWHHFFGKSNSKAIPVAQTNGMRPSGYHLNKHGYYLSSIATWLEPGTVWVKGRRRNPLNPRALHRSIARLLSAKHAVKKLHILDVPRRQQRRRLSSGRIPIGRRLKAG